MIDQKSLQYHRKDVEIPEDLVPIKTVLDDMGDPDRGYAYQAARIYYYQHYATDEEREQMDRSDRRWKIGGYLFLLFIAGLLLSVVLSQFIK